MLVRKHLLQFNDLILSLNMSYLNVLCTTHPLNLHLIVVKVFVCQSDPRSYVIGGLCWLRSPRQIGQTCSY